MFAHQRNTNTSMKFVQWGTTLACFVAMMSVAPLAHAATSPQGNVPDHYIVKLAKGTVVQKVASELASRFGLEVGFTYGHAFHGFAARIGPAKLALLRKDPRVLKIYPDTYVSIENYEGLRDIVPLAAQPAQTLPSGIARINADKSSAGAGNRSDSVDVDVAVIDTGIFPHPDLNVAGGYSCVFAPFNKWKDANGHGTHVSGTIGAIDNDIGVVGVAPGARLWAVRVLNALGAGTASSVICGIDWVTQHADVIEVANMSLGGGGNDGACDADPQHEAICNAVAAGVTFVVAAGNSRADSEGFTPAAYDEVITVSSLADFDGLPGGHGTSTCYQDEDDSLSNFSNYGADVDVIAPGSCITSTWKDNGYNTISGTSMASPHATGAAALYKSTHKLATPAQVKRALISAGTLNWDNADDGDNTQEPLLDVQSF